MLNRDVILDVQNLSRAFPGGMAVDDISFDIERGEVVGLMGLNGAGKTTTLRLLSSYLSPSCGRISVLNMDMRTHAIEIRRHVGYLPENAPLYPEMRVVEFLRYRAKLKGLRGSAMYKRLDALYDRCQLGDIYHRVIGRLSKGHRQRVAFVDCLIQRPDLLLLDEPTIGLDNKQTRIFHQQIKDLAPAAAVLLATHSFEEVETICTRVIVLHEGRIVADHPIERFVAGTRQFRAEVRASREAVSGMISGLPDVEKASVQELPEGWVAITLFASMADPREALCQAANQKKWAIRSLSMERRMEDAYMHYIRQGGGSP